jgi:hypothetical protein
MGNCYHCREREGENETTVVLYDEVYYLRENIYKVFRINPMHNYGTRRQIQLERDYEVSKKQRNPAGVKLIDQLSSFFTGVGGTCSKIFDNIEQNIITYTIRKLEEHLSLFKTCDNLFINVFMFVLSNTKNNIDRKQEIVNEIINDSFFNNDTEKQVDVKKIKYFIKSIIKISLSIFLNFIILQVFVKKENIPKMLEDEADKTNIPDLIYGNIRTKLKQGVSYNNLLEKWEDYLLTPIIFAGYSNAKNIVNYNLKLKEEITTRMVNLFDTDKIISSILRLQIE